MKRYRQDQKHPILVIQHRGQHDRWPPQHVVLQTLPAGQIQAARDTSSHGVCSTKSSLVIRYSTMAALLAITAAPRYSQ